MGKLSLFPSVNAENTRLAMGEWTLEQLQLCVCVCVFFSNNFVLLSVLEALFWAKLVCFLL